MRGDKRLARSTTYTLVTQKFVAVIGPNGSGKSNLLESLLFIFGHRASKMRLKQLNELIHVSSGHFEINKAAIRVKFLEIEEVRICKVGRDRKQKNTRFL